MKTILIIFGILTVCTTANADSLEVGDYNTTRYQGDDYSGMFVAKTGVYNNAGFIGRGVKFDALYLGMVIGLTDTDKINSGGLDFATGVLACAIKQQNKR